MASPFVPVAHSVQRKRHYKDIKCVFFPDDVENGLQKVGREPTALSSVSSAKSWKKCGDSFLDSPLMKVEKGIIDIILTT